jgi:hypothetical protein
VTIATNAPVVGTSAATDTLTVAADLTSGGAAKLAASAFETVTVTVAQTVGNAMTIQASATTLNVGVAGTYVVGAGITATNVTAGSPTITDDNKATAETFINSGTGLMTVTLVAETAATADTIANTGTGRVTIGAAANTGVLTVNLNANSAVDTINLNDTAANALGLVAAANRVVISNFGSTDLITLDTKQTTAGTAAGSNAVLQSVAAVPAANVTFGTAAADVLVLSFDVGGSTEVLAGVLNGAALLANFGGFTLSVTATTNKGYILAYDNGNAYIYAVTEGAADNDAAVAADDIALIGVINGAAVGSITAANLPLGG